MPLSPRGLCPRWRCVNRNIEFGACQIAGRLFEMLADLTDEDGAYTELEDLGGLADWLLDDE